MATHMYWVWTPSSASNCMSSARANAATSPALNIAEGKGRYSKKEFVQFLYVARGSLFETVTLLVIFRRRGWLPQEDYRELRKAGTRLGKRISALITSVRQSTHGS